MISRWQMPYRTMSQIKLAKRVTTTQFPVPTTILQQVIPGGLVRPQELLPNPLLRVHFLGDRQCLVQGLQVSSLEVKDPSPQAPEPQGSIPEHPLPLVAFHLVQGYLDSIRQDQVLPDSFRQALEPQGNSQGSILLVEPQGNTLGNTLLEGPQGNSLGSTPQEETRANSQEFHTQRGSPGHSPPAQVHLQGLAGPSLVVGCMDREAQECSLQLLARAPFQHSRVEPFPRSLQGRGVPRVGEASLPSQATPAPSGLGPWDPMVGRPLQEACCPDLIHRIFESMSELSCSVG